ncbi:MAG TPA: ABC transporter permease [Candidatus Sulfotelmatobacter sp.]|nr:ABC transporter permease [Candidatus Sulfotelmatobacter sp.]
MLSVFLADVKFALRQLRRSPGFAAAAIVTLALGIGTTTAIFSLVDGILLRPLPFSNAERLVAVDTLEFPPGVAPTNVAAADYSESSYPDFFDWQRQSHMFESLASYNNITRLFSRNDGVGARVLVGGRVSANFFPTIGVAPALGRNFTVEEEQPGQRVAILSHELWVSDFASSPSVIGQVVKISDEPYTVIGVMPAGFHYPVGNPGFYWSTYAIESEGPTGLTKLRDQNDLNVVGLLKPGVSTQQATADLNTVQRGLSQQYSEDRLRLAVAVMPLLDEAVSDARSHLWFLFLSVGVLLLIGCANVAGLLLARANRRRPELALRTALGASRGRVVRQLLVEALLLAAGGGVFGILLSFAFLRIAPRFIPDDLPRLYNANLDFRVLMFAVLLSAATAIGFGLLPAWIMSRQDPAHSLRECGLHMTSGRRRNRLHQLLVVGQTALGFTLLIGSGLLIRSLVNVLHIEPGFDIHNRVFFDIALTNKRYPVPGKAVFYDKLMPELAALPGVEQVGAGHPLPILQEGSTTNFTIANRSYDPDNVPNAQATVVMPGYFETLSIPLVRGRLFTAHDNDAHAPPVAMINQAFARQFFAGEDPIGQYITPTFPYTDEPIVPRQIVGIVGDTRVNDLFAPYRAQFFLPYAQDPSHQRPLVVMKVSGDPSSYESAVRKLVARFDPDSPVFSYRTFIEETDIKAAQSRFEALLVSGFSAIALLLSALGLYAVLSYVVGERIRELGLRMAFGASRSDILRLVLQRAAILSLMGAGLGVVASIFTTRFVADLLINVAPLDRSVFLSVTFLLFAVSMLAALAPALRAASLDPVHSLRDE